MSQLIRQLMGTFAPGTFTLPAIEPSPEESEEEEQPQMVYRGPVTMTPAGPPVLGPDGRYYAQRPGMIPFPTHATHRLYEKKRK